MSKEFRYYAFLKMIKLQQNAKKINKWINKANNLKFVKNHGWKETNWRCQEKVQEI